ncbi:MAG: hypothetical protein V1744_07170 [Candidatus Altiarchaeota archaeon]
MRISDPILYAAVLYAVLSTSLLVHEFGHIYSAQYVTKDCMFTETELRFDLLLFRRAGMTYFTCSHGISRLERPSFAIDLNDPTLPTLKIKVAKAEGIRLLTSPLTTGWFTALTGPALELAYMTILLDWLSKTFRRLKPLKLTYLFLLLLVFASSRLDFQQAVPEDNTSLFIAAYVLAYLIIALAHVTLNMGSYKKFG